MWRIPKLFLVTLYQACCQALVLAMNRPVFSDLLNYIWGRYVACVRRGRLGRDAIDVQSTIRSLLAKGVQVVVRGLGVIGKGVGELIVPVPTQFAEMERKCVRDRTATARQTEKVTLAAIGRTYRGKDSLSRPPRGDVATVRAWGTENRALSEQLPSTSIFLISPLSDTQHKALAARA